MTLWFGAGHAGKIMGEIQTQIPPGERTEILPYDTLTHGTSAYWHGV